MAKLYGKGKITEVIRGKKYYIELSAGRDPLSGRVYESSGKVPDKAYAIDDNGKKVIPPIVYGTATDKEKSVYTHWQTKVDYIRLREMFYGTKRQAELRLEEMRQEAKSGKRANADKVTYAELSDEFITREEKHGVNRHTQKPLRTATKEDLRTTEKAILRIPWFASKSVSDITAGDLLDLYDDMRESGIGATTVYKAHRQVNRVMKHAIKNRIITFNPVDDLDERDIPAKPTPNRRRMTEDEVVRALRHLLNSEPTARKAAVVIGLCEGMRRGEIFGLQWKHIHFDRGFIEVRQQLTKKKELIETKTDETHIVPLEPILADYLMNWKKAQASYIDSLNIDDNGDADAGYRIKQTDETPVITDSLGSWYHPKNFSKWYREWCVSEGLGHWETEDGQEIVELTIGDDPEPFEDCHIEWRTEEGWPCDANGRKYSRSNTRPKTSRHYKGADFHGLRRSFFTLRMADQDNPCDIKTLQALGGWSTPDMLLNVYAVPVESRVMASSGFIGNLMEKSDSVESHEASSETRFAHNSPIENSEKEKGQGL